MGRWCGCSYPQESSKNTVDNHRGMHHYVQCFGKTFIILNNRLILGAETYEILIEEQAGFRSNRSAVDNLFVSHSIINSTLQNGNTSSTYIEIVSGLSYLIVV